MKIQIPQAGIVFPTVLCETGKKLLDDGTDISTMAYEPSLLPKATLQYILLRIILLENFAVSLLPLLCIDC